MDKEELFAAAKQEIFGEKPTCSLARIGYDMAVRYYGTIVPAAESALLEIAMPTDTLRTELKNASNFVRDVDIDAFMPETKEALVLCAENFNARYAPLLEELNFKAA